LYVSRYGGGSCKLSVRMHTSKCIGHTIGSGTSCHVVRMKGTSCTAAGSNGEVFLAFLVAFLLVGTCNGMLETCGVGGVTGDGNVNALFPHDGNAFLNAVRAVAVNLRAESFGVCLAEYFFYFVGVGIVLCLNICKSVDTGNDLCGVFAKSVQDNAERFLTNLVRLLSDTDSALCRCKGLMACQEAEALCLFFQKHLTQVAVSKAYFTGISNGSRNTESLKTFTDSCSCVRCSL